MKIKEKTTIGCDGGSITLYVKRGDYYPYLYGGYIGDLFEGKEIGAYAQIDNLIEELQCLQKVIQKNWPRREPKMLSSLTDKELIAARDKCR